MSCLRGKAVSLLIEVEELEGVFRPRLEDFAKFSKEYTIDVGAHRDAPLQVSDKSDQNLVKIFR